MKTETQASDALAHVAELIEDIPTAMLTLVGADGVLTGRPMTVLEIDASGALWLFADRRTLEGERLDAVHLGFGDAVTQTWVSLSGRGRIETDRAHIDALWTADAGRWFPDGPDSPSLALLKITPDRAEYWDADENRTPRKVGVIVAGPPVETGEHGTHSGLSRRGAAS